MAEALAAVSLASAIIGIISFAVQTLEILRGRVHGHSKAFTTLERVIAELHILGMIIQSPGSIPARTEPALQACRRLVGEMSDQLKTINELTSENKGIRSMIQSRRVSKAERELGMMLVELERHKSSLMMALGFELASGEAAATTIRATEMPLKAGAGTAQVVEIKVEMESTELIMREARRKLPDDDPEWSGVLMWLRKSPNVNGSGGRKNTKNGNLA